MKNTILTVFFFLFLIQTKAQQIAVNTEPVTKIPASALNWENQKLRSDLTLNDSQFVAIKDITLERYKARQIVEEMFRLEPKKKTIRIKEIERQFDAEFAEVLNSKQYKKYLKLQGRDQEDVEVIVAGNQEPEGPNFNAQIQELLKKATTPVLDSALLPKQNIQVHDFAITSDSLTEIFPAGFQVDQSASPDSVRKLATLIPENQPGIADDPNGRISLSGEPIELPAVVDPIKSDNGIENELPNLTPENIEGASKEQETKEVTEEIIKLDEGLEIPAP